ncbi:hypothetical protein GE061_019159 [Apolygus lucorum]|uniref:DUF7869 domain-containing protein n=1 Tax=Apolygus lucorum TaxID=248454 RepID=A0A6A4JWG4_APOLU|nr:hypothetical protein GE061_019159 [Apolygus lucorum]
MTSKLYLSPDLNMRRLHTAFKNKFPECSFVSYQFYRKIVKCDFPNYSFARPRTDTCRTCDLLAAKVKTANNDLLRQRLKKTLELHHMKAEKAMDVHRKKIAESKMPGCKFSNMAIDLQQVMFVPTLTHSDMFYQRQLSCYNLGVNISDSGQSYLCMWSELEAGRGGNEVISCIFHILNDAAIIHRKNIAIWSDNCVGQHKNKMAVLMYMFLIANGIYHTIEHNFLVSGHSFLPCDRDFALVEKRKKVTKAFIPSDLHEIVRSAKTTVPFKIVDMTDKPFFDFGEPAKKLLNAEKLKIKTVAGIKVTRNSIETGTVFTKSKSKGAWKPVKILKKNVSVQHLRALTLSSIEHCNRISVEKKNDLLSMIEYLPNEDHKKFYLENLK